MMQRVNLTNARIQGNLNGETLKNKQAIVKGSKGKKRGPQKKKSRVDDVKVISSVLGENHFEGETYVKLTNGKLLAAKDIPFLG